MHTYTHAATSFLLGKVIFSANQSMQTGLVMGSIAPDLPALVEGAKRYFTKKESKPTISLQHHILHSLLVWAVLGLISLALFFGRTNTIVLDQLLLWFVSFCLGGFLHVLVDRMSHKLERRHGQFEVFATKTYVWPLTYELNKLRVFDYRSWIWDQSGKSIFNLVTTPEVIISLLCFVLAVLL